MPRQPHLEPVPAKMGVDGVSELRRSGTKILYYAVSAEQFQQDTRGGDTQVKEAQEPEALTF